VARVLRGVWQDVVFAARVLAKDRRFTVAAVLALALAIGVNNSVFALINTAVLRELPFERADRLVSAGVSTGRGLGPVSYPDFRDWRAGTRAFEELAAAVTSVMNLSEPDRLPERFRGTYVSANAFRALRVAPRLGRDFLPEDDRDGAPAVVILAHAVWQMRYGGDPAVLGRTVRINDVPATIVGVMPDAFSFPFNNQLWQPLSVATFVRKPQRNARSVQMFGRLADGVTLERARAEVDAVGRRLAAEFPDPSREKLRPMVIAMREDYRVRAPFLGLFMGAVALVLLVACANLANLMLARSVARSREVALRVSLGATRWRIVRQLLTESALIAACAGVLGSLFSIYGANTVAVAFDPIEPGFQPGPTRPFFVDLSFNGTTYLFVGLLCAFATLACGLLPALQASKADASHMLKDGGRGAAGSRRVRRWSQAFIVAEVALTLMLLTSTGLIWRSFLHRYQRDLVIDTNNLAVMRVGLPIQKYATPESRNRFFDRLDERLRAIPLIGAGTMANAAPFEEGAARELSVESRVETAGAGSTRPTVSLIQTGDRYLETIGLRVVNGRALTSDDRQPGLEGAVVDQRFASTYFPDGNVLGQRIGLAPVTGALGATPPPSPWLTIVGVAAQLPYLGPPSLDRPLVYAPIGALPLQGPATIIVRSADVRAAAMALREEVRGLDADLPLYSIETVDAAVARSRHPLRLVGTWFATIAGIALILAAVGLYALMAHRVSQRTQEIGVRLALGAGASDVLWLFLRGAVAQVTVGLVIGTAGVFATGQFLRLYLGDMNPRDPLTLSVVAAVLVIVAIGSSLIPARRATRVDPMVSLRYE
jgi:putative ABC transport system permease protein